MCFWTLYVLQIEHYVLQMPRPRARPAGSPGKFKALDPPQASDPKPQIPSAVGMGWIRAPLRTGVILDADFKSKLGRL